MRMVFGGSTLAYESSTNGSENPRAHHLALSCPSGFSLRDHLLVITCPFSSERGTSVQALLRFILSSSLSIASFQSDPQGPDSAVLIIRRLLA